MKSMRHTPRRGSATLENFVVLPATVGATVLLVGAVQLGLLVVATHAAAWQGAHRAAPLLDAGMPEAALLAADDAARGMVALAVSPASAPMGEEALPAWEARKEAARQITQVMIATVPGPDAGSGSEAARVAKVTVEVRPDYGRLLGWLAPDDFHIEGSGACAFGGWRAP
ncbi:MAG: hypothetical protein ABIO70_23310 [Pseudomonadota bacterium]